MSMTLTSSSRTITLPRYAVGGLKPQHKPNIAKNYPLAGNLYVDFFNVRSGYRVQFPEITRAEYEEIKTIYNDQLINEEFLLLNDPDLGIIDLSVYLNLPTEYDLKWNKEVAGNVTIELEPENADSL